MEKKFGAFDTIEELNRAAAAQLKEGDEEALFALAEENGLEKDDVLDYMDGIAEVLASPLMAAMGKIKLEQEELKCEGFLKDCADSVITECMESEAMCHAVFRKDRSLSGYMGALLKYAFDNKVRIDDRIVKAAKLNPPIYLGIPGSTEVQRIIREYYMGVKKP